MVKISDIQCLRVGVYDLFDLGIVRLVIVGVMQYNEFISNTTFFTVAFWCPTVFLGFHYIYTLRCLV